MQSHMTSPTGLSDRGLSSPTSPRAWRHSQDRAVIGRSEQDAEAEQRRLHEKKAAAVRLALKGIGHAGDPERLKHLRHQQHAEQECQHGEEKLARASQNKSLPLFDEAVEHFKQATQLDSTHQRAADNVRLARAQREEAQEFTTRRQLALQAQGRRRVALGQDVGVWSESAGRVVSARVFEVDVEHYRVLYELGGVQYAKKIKVEDIDGRALALQEGTPPIRPAVLSAHMSSPQAARSPQAYADHPAQPREGGSMEAWLARHALQDLQAPLREHDYRFIEDLMGASEQELEEIFEDAQIRPATKRRFWWSLRHDESLDQLKDTTRVKENELRAFLLAEGLAHHHSYIVASGCRYLDELLGADWVQLSEISDGAKMGSFEKKRFMQALESFKKRDAKTKKTKAYGKRDGPQKQAGGADAA